MKQEKKYIYTHSVRFTVDGGRRVVRFLRVYKDGTSDERIYSYGALDPLPAWPDDPHFMFLKPDKTKHKRQSLHQCLVDIISDYYGEVF